MVGKDSEKSGECVWAWWKMFAVGVDWRFSGVWVWCLLGGDWGVGGVKMGV